MAAEVTEVAAARMAGAVISEAGGTLPAVTEDMVAIGAVMVATVAMEDEEATDIAEVTAVGAGAALASGSGSDFTTHLCLSTIQRFGARTARLITTLMTTTINGTEMRTSMKPSVRRQRYNSKPRISRRT